jgi:peroxiredoxin (alkyl hydroperoxide reductase subunit C)
MVSADTMAPDFELRSHTGATVKLSDFRGKQNVVIAFHPLAFTPVCAAQMQTYEKDKGRFEKLGAHILSISVDAGPAKKAWADWLGGISFDLLADFHPKGKVASDYGVMRDDGISARALFVVDKTGKVTWAKLYQIPEQPDKEELFRELEKIA